MNILCDWVNHELSLSVEESTLEHELASGFILGALLHRHNQLPGHHKLRRRTTPDAKIANFVLLEPALTKLGVAFDVVTAEKMIRGEAGVGSMVLYRVKMALDKLVANSSPVSVRTPGVQALPNLPHRSRKPQFEQAKSFLFEKRLREVSDNPNDVMLKRHLRSFEDAGRASRVFVETAKAQERRAHDEHRAMSRTARLYRKQQDAAFAAAWDDKFRETWRDKRVELASKRRDLEAKALARAERKEQRMREAEAHMKASVATALDDFDQALARRPPPDDDDEDDPLPTIEITHVDGRKEIVLDARKLETEFQAQRLEMRSKKEEREREAYERAKRKREMMLRKADAFERANDARSRQAIVAAIQRKSQEDIDRERDLAVTAKYKDRLVENRRYREAQCAAREKFETQEKRRRDEALLRFDVQAFRDDVSLAVEAYESAAAARQAAKRKSANDLCLGIVIDTVNLALSILELRDADNPAPQYQGQTFSSVADWTLATAPEEKDAMRSILLREDDLDASDLDEYLDATDDVGALGEAIVQVRQLSVDEPAPKFKAPSTDKVRICLAGPTFSGKTEQASRIAARFDLRVVSAASLVDDALQAADAVTLGKAEVTAVSELGREASRHLLDGGSVPDDVCARLVAQAVGTIDGGWVLDDFPATAEQAAALEKVLTGYDGSPHPTRWDFASRLATPAPKPEPRWPGLEPESHEEFVPSGVDLALVLDATIDDCLRRALGRRFDPETSRDYHLEFDSPPHDAVARLECVDDPTIHLRLAAYDAAQPALLEYLARFGTARRVPCSEAPDAVASAVSVHVEACIAHKEAQRQSAAREKERIEAEREALLQAATLATDRAWAQAAAAAAAAEDVGGGKDVGGVVTAANTARDAALALAEAAEASLLRGGLPAPVEPPMERAMAQDLANSWNCAERAFVEGAKLCFRASRDERRSALRALSERRLEMARFLARPDDRQHSVDAFVRLFNAVPLTVRHQDEAKAELHVQVEELRNALWERVERRRDEATAILEAWGADGSVDRARLFASRNHAALVQLEVDRTHAAVQLLHDVHHAITKQPLAKLGFDEAPAKPTKSDVVTEHGLLVSAADGRQPLPPQVVDLAEASAAKDDDKKASKKKAADTPPPSPLDIAVSRALDFASAWAQRDPEAQPRNSLEAAVWHEVVLLRRRVGRIEEQCKRAVSDVEGRAAALATQLAAWRDQRIHAELAVVEALVARCREAIEDECFIEHALTLDGVVLHVDPNAALVPFYDCSVWRTHPRAHQLLVHTELRSNLPAPPPEPTPLVIPEDRFADHQLRDLAGQLYRAAGDPAAHITHDLLRQVIERASLRPTALPAAWRGPAAAANQIALAHLETATTDGSASTTVPAFLAYAAAWGVVEDAPAPAPGLVS